MQKYPQLKFPSEKVHLGIDQVKPRPNNPT